MFQNNHEWRAFSSDDRLNSTFSSSRPYYVLHDLLTSVRRRTGVTLYTPEEELRRCQITVSFSDVSVRSIMESISGLYYLGWERDSRKNYRLLPQANVFDTYLPQDSLQQELQDLGLKNLSALEDFFKQPGKPASLSSLPASLRADVSRMIDIARKSSRPENWQETTPTTNPDSCQILFNKRPVDSFTLYQFRVRTPKQYMLFSFSDYSLQKQECARAVSSGKIAVYYPDSRTFVPPPTDTTANQTMMKEIRFTGATIREILALLQEKYPSLNYCTDDPKTLRERYSGVASGRSVSEMIASIEGQVPKTEWQLLPDTMLLVRGPENTQRGKRG